MEELRAMGRAKGAAGRPAWATAMAVFCLATVVFLVVRDLFVPHVRNVEVWLGFELRGTAALVTAPLHWAIFLLGAWAFWRDRPWAAPAAAAYSFYVGFSHLVWNLVSASGGGWPAGLAQAVLFSLPGVGLLWAHRRRQRAAPGRRPPREP